MPAVVEEQRESLPFDDNTTEAQESVSRRSGSETLAPDRSIRSEDKKTPSVHDLTLEREGLQSAPVVTIEQPTPDVPVAEEQLGGSEKIAE